MGAAVMAVAMVGAARGGARGAEETVVAMVGEMEAEARVVVVGG